MSKSALLANEPAPWFVARCTANERFHIDTAAGRPMVLCFFRSAGDASSARVLADFMQHRRRFDDVHASFFGVSIDPDDERLERIRQTLPGLRYFWDFDFAVSRLYRAMDEAAADNGQYRRCSVVLDERLRIFAVVSWDDAPDLHVDRVLKALESLPPIPSEQFAAVQAPVLVVPRIFEPELCRELIRFYDRLGGQESGFMREVNGQTVMVLDPGFKRRRDREITDERLRKAAMFRIHDRLCPEILKAFQFPVTRIERHIVACYDSATGGYFSPHRDNTTKGTAHRRFAVSLHLNTGEYGGGQLRFPEFGRQTHEAPAGGAVVFSCSLLHEATPVTSGRRYVYLPFLYDDAAAAVRQANLKFLADSPLSNCGSES